MNIITMPVDPFDLPSVLVEEIRQLPKTSGIYFVLAGDEVLYIGQSISIHQRWQAHERMKDLEAYNQVRIAWLVTEYEELAEIEKAYIAQFKPSLNSMSVPRQRDKLTVYLEPELNDWVRQQVIIEKRRRGYHVEISDIINEALQKMKDSQ